MYCMCVSWRMCVCVCVCVCCVCVRALESESTSKESNILFKVMRLANFSTTNPLHPSITSHNDIYFMFMNLNYAHLGFHFESPELGRFPSAFALMNFT